MTSSSGRKSGSSGRSTGRKRVVIGAEETTRVRYSQDRPQVESERRHAQRSPQRASAAARSTKTGPKPTGVGRRIAGVKRDERQKRQTALARRRTALGIVALVAIVLALWGIVAFWRAPILQIKQVEVSGNKHLSNAAVLKLAAIPPDATLMRFDSGAAETRLMRNPWVASATVTRRLPGVATVAVDERTAAAVIDAGGTNLWLVDGDGVWLGKLTSKDSTGLVTVRDIEALKPKAGERTKSAEVRNALAVIRGLSPEMKEQLKTISAPTIDKTALITKSDIQIMVGSAEDIAKKDRVARKILEEERGAVYVNVRVVDRATWRGLDESN